MLQLETLMLVILAQFLIIQKAKAFHVEKFIKLTTSIRYGYSKEKSELDNNQIAI